MEVNLSFVPPGGGETDYTLTVEMPAVPQQGDYLIVRRENQTGTEDCIVRKTWWHLNIDELGKGATRNIWVECEFALSPFSSEAHKQACEMYQRRTGMLLEFDESMY